MTIYALFYWLRTRNILIYRSLSRNIHGTNSKFTHFHNAICYGDYTKYSLDSYYATVYAFYSMGLCMEYDSMDNRSFTDSYAFFYSGY